MKRIYNIYFRFHRAASDQRTILFSIFLSTVILNSELSHISCVREMFSFVCPGSTAINYIGMPQVLVYNKEITSLICPFLSSISL